MMQFIIENREVLIILYFYVISSVSQALPVDGETFTWGRFAINFVHALAQNNFRAKKSLP
jgi:hypothetical protein